MGLGDVFKANENKNLLEQTDMLNAEVCRLNAEVNRLKCLLTPEMLTGTITSFFTSKATNSDHHVHIDGVTLSDEQEKQVLAYVTSLTEKELKV